MGEGWESTSEIDPSGYEDTWEGVLLKAVEGVTHRVLLSHRLSQRSVSTNGNEEEIPVGANGGGFFDRKTESPCSTINCSI